MRPAKLLQTILLRTTGYRLVKDRVNHSGDISHPCELFYRRQCVPEVTISVPVHKGRVLNWFSLEDCELNPYIRAVRKSAETGYTSDTIATVIEQYARSVTYSNANQKIGLEYSAPVFPTDSHPYESVAPWTAKDPAKALAGNLKKIKEENRAQGLNATDFVGSVSYSSAKTAVEVSRLFELVRSIRDRGLVVTEKEPISAVILIHGNEWRWMVGGRHGGHHRVGVAAALGETSIPVTVSRIVRREDVECWPNVVSGLYPVDLALRVFDQRFNPTLPPALRGWERAVQKGAI